MASVAMANNGGTTPSDQIRQMVNFILQEAHEKANEIRVKVRLDCKRNCRNEYVCFDDAVFLKMNANAVAFSFCFAYNPFAVLFIITTHETTIDRA